MISNMLTSNKSWSARWQTCSLVQQATHTGVIVNDQDKEMLIGPILQDPPLSLWVERLERDTNILGLSNFRLLFVLHNEEAKLLPTDAFFNKQEIRSIELVSAQCVAFCMTKQVDPFTTPFDLILFF